MPKKKKPGRRISSPSDYARTLFQTETARSKPETTPFRFLDLHPELRMMIYGYYATIPAAGPNEVDKSERQQAIKTRRSLHSVCKQMAEEWNPIFYQQKTLLVNSKLPREHRILSWLNPWRGYSASKDFGEKFLKQLPSYRLRNIRRLEYDVNWAGNSQLNDIPHPIGDTAFDLEGARGLPKVLFDHRNILQSLEEVVISAQYYRWVHQHDFDGVSSDKYPARWWCLATDLNSRVRFGPKFEELRKAFQSRSRFGICKSWDMQKIVWVSLPETYLFSKLRKSKVLPSVEIQKVALVFRKNENNSPTSRPSQESDSTSLLPWGPMVGTESSLRQQILDKDNPA